MVLLTRNRFTVARSYPIERDTSIDAGVDGVVIQRGTSALDVYSAGANLNIGDGFAAEYLRPGTPNPTPSPASTRMGCTVSFFSMNGDERTVRYAQACSQLRETKPWKKP